MKMRMIAGLLLTVSLAGLRADAFTDRRVEVVNRSSSPIQYLYARTSDPVGPWSADMLGSWVMIWQDRSLVMNIDNGSDHCLYDLRAVLFDGRVALGQRVNVCDVGQWTVSDDR